MEVFRTKETFTLYLEESIMFTTLFTLALRKAGTKGSMAIAFLIPLVGYGVIGENAAKKRKLFWCREGLKE